MAQDTKREQPVRLPNPGAQPFVAALKTLRFFAVIFFWLAMVSMLAHVAAFVSAEWLHLYESATAPEPAAATASGPSAAETPAAAQPAPPVAAPDQLTPEQHRDRAMRYQEYTAGVLRPMRALGILSAMLLLVTLFLYLQIALLGRLSGIRPLTRALGLALVFLAAVVPWHNLFEEVRFGAFFDFAALLEIQAEHAQWSAGDLVAAAGYYARFLAVPAAGVVVLALAGIQFAAGYRESVLVNE
ncbi:MAG: hypothetical protein WBD63_00560 [Phycisphaerae bacterium]